MVSAEYCMNWYRLYYFTYLTEDPAHKTEFHGYQVAIEIME